MSDVLAKICSDKRVLVERLKSAMPFTVVDSEARRATPPREFANALFAKVLDAGTAIIAEIKKASPSAGILRPDFFPTKLAQAYEAGGAACLSVLTDGPYFQGANEDLIEARAACSLPVLRKDFLLDVWQVAESRSLGADCVLLIMAALNDSQAADLHAAAKDYGMDILIEVHNRVELDRALRLSSGMIGINNRDLKTLKVSLGTSEDLVSLIPPDRIIVSESGITTASDVKRMKSSGIHCFLVGESLLKQSDVTFALRALVG